MKYLLRCQNCGHEWEESHEIGTDLNKPCVRAWFKSTCPECDYETTQESVLVSYEEVSDGMQDG